ncbi:MAG: glycosyl transferase, WecB/TagA/CpsF family [Caulobacter sp.]|nr:glycosyl transferase, WecB/TagA/CpsF family [Caulobacter sp.]
MNSPANLRLRLLGAEVDPVTPREMLDTTEAFIAGGGTAVIANHNSHSLYLSQHSAEMRGFFEDADLIQVDSTPMIIWGWLMGRPLGMKHRSTYLDWREDLWRRAQAGGWRIFYLGGEPGVAAKGAAAVEARWPGVKIAVHDGYFDATPGSEGSEAVNRMITAFDADIILVGMGMPRQEGWIRANRYRIGRGVFFPVGAAFDYEAGAQVAAPRWTGRIGLEWLFRLATQPRRLAYRYLVEPWSLMPAAFDDIRGAVWGQKVRRTHLGLVRRPGTRVTGGPSAPITPGMSYRRDTTTPPSRGTGTHRPL